ncbi:hypothetical protein P171DRAFT_132114 [Karstenula rhodostoma CBS 690.94]|uniref:Uncharacterized protein n=1 Tax=Karstenula rhodostoma CBS 690.94 TaxID=1392251 RepID=A0A9P4P9R2_9PLEO|nr:hypothetical protein P171DRAFT_132114 [Karstenula rhodostoma CBS 690.94]
MLAVATHILLYKDMVRSTTLRYASLPPLRPKRPAKEAPPLTPAPPFCVMETEDESSPCTATGLGISSSPPAVAPTSNSEINPSLPGTAWPSEVASRTTTSWLLPPHNDQSSAIAMLLKTEIEAHKISKEMLHATEQKRLDAVHYCRHLEVAKHRLEKDVYNWIAAYNALAVAFCQRSAEYNRMAVGNAAQGVNIISQATDQLPHHENSLFQEQGEDQIDVPLANAKEEDERGEDQYVGSEDT